MGIELVRAWVCDYVDCGNVWLSEDGTEPQRCSRCKRERWNREQEDATGGVERFVYVMYSPREELHKIGHSANPEQRRVALGANVQLIAAYPTRQSLHCEQALHRHFAEQRKHGEWFSLSPGDLEWIAKWKLYHPVTTAGFRSTAVTCLCHLPRFMASTGRRHRDKWEDWTTVPEGSSLAAKPVREVSNPKPERAPTVARLVAAHTERPAHDAATCRVYNCGLCAVSGKRA